MGRKPKNELSSVLSFINSDRLKSIKQQADGSFELELYPEAKEPIPNALWLNSLPGAEKQDEKANTEMSLEQMERTYDDLLLEDPMEAEKQMIALLKKEGLQ